MNHEPLRYAHDEGHTDVCFSSDGSKFITCGADGDVRIWSTKDDTDPSHNCIGDWALSVCEKNGNLYISTSDNDIQILSFPSGEKNGLLDRFTAPINQISSSKNSDHIALAGEDMEVKLYDLSKSKSENKIFDGLSGPCLSVAVCSQFVASSCGDGKLRIWDIESKELQKEIECFPKVNSFANADLLCRIDFSPDGKTLAYPHEETVVLLDTINFNANLLKCPEVNNPYSLVQFSPCGQYLAATTNKGDIVIFHVYIKKVKKISKHPSGLAISGLMWNPKKNGQIVYTDIEGQLGLASECLGKEPQNDEIFSENEVDFGDVQFESDDDNENVVSVEKLKKEVMGDLEPELASLDSSSSTPRPRTPEVSLQPPFMPSSTPEHLNPRYLCWNDIAVIRSYGSLTDEDSSKSIEIDFHNATFHNSMMLQNYQDYTMGTVSTAAVAVANAKQIHVIPLSASTKEWILKLEDSPEEIVLIAASETLICFATSHYFVRISSIYGTQRGVFLVPGPLVSMTCFQNSLMVAYHFSSPRKTDQCMKIKHVKFDGLRLTSTDIDVSLGPEATLLWMGFTDVGTPAMMDSLGMLSFYPKSGNIWIPVCDTTKNLKSPADGFFVTTVIESQQVVFGIKCRGSVYPGFTPKPTVCEIPLAPPFAEPETDKTQLEMNLFTWSNLQVGDIEKKFSETGLKAFALACKNNLDQRAVELMEILGNQQLLNLATKYAMKMNKKLIGEKLMELGSKLVGDGEDNSFIVTSTPPISISRRKFSIGSKRTPKLQKIEEKTEEAKAPVATLEAIPESPNVSLNVTVDESFTEQIPKNPFAKKTKKNEEAVNPLSLVNKHAGLDYVDTKENKFKNSEKEKRKQPESSECVEPREKQRKLDKFMFSKRV